MLPGTRNREATKREMRIAISEMAMGIRIKFIISPVLDLLSSKIRINKNSKKKACLYNKSIDQSLVFDLDSFL